MLTRVSTRSNLSFSTGAEGRVRFYKMNISEGVDTCLKYGVLSVPKMLIFKDGHVVAQRVGSASSAVLASFIKAHI